MAIQICLIEDMAGQSPGKKQKKGPGGATSAAAVVADTLGEKSSTPKKGSHTALLIVKVRSLSQSISGFLGMPGLIVL